MTIGAAPERSSTLHQSVSLWRAARRPRPGRYDQGWFSQPFSAQLTQLVTLARAQARDERSRGADSQGVGLPPLLKGRMLDLDRDRTVLDLPQPGGVEQLGEMAASSTRARGLIVHVTVQGPGGAGSPRRAPRRG